VVTGLVLFARRPADDSYIVARYAWQLLHGHGLVFNVGERINALTSPAQLAVFVALSTVFADPVRPWQWIAALATIVSTLLVGRRIFPGSLVRAAFLAVALASPFVLLWTVGGMETPLLFVLACWLAVLALAEPPLTRHRALSIIALALLCVFTRYDAVLFAGPIALLAVILMRGDRAVRWASLLAVATFGIWLAFTRWYYGDILPTSFYVKFPRADFAERLVLGVEYVLSFAVLTWLGLALAWRVRRGGAAGRGPLVSGVWVGLALVLAYGVLAGTVHMMYAYRFFVPYLPVLWLCLMNGVAADRAKPHAPSPARLRWGTAAALALQSLLLVFVWRYSENPNLSLAVFPQTDTNERHEFSLVGERYGAAADRAVRLQAKELDAHWRTRPESDRRPPRMAVQTAGVLPFFLPDAYVLELLVSYRHLCPSPHQAAADYWQVFRDLPAGEAAAAPMPPHWYLISAHNVDVTALTQPPHRVSVELWFQPYPAEPRLPATVDGACLPPLPGGR
jgi:hypothetical protein